MCIRDRLKVAKTIRSISLDSILALSKAIFADVGTKAKKNDDSNTIAIPFHLLLSNLVIITFKQRLTTSRVEILFCIIVCCLGTR